MFTIQIQFCKNKNLLLAALCLILSGNVVAQDLEWPKTFNGQPDFDFIREEIIKEMEEELSLAGELENIASIDKTLKSRIIDPFAKMDKILLTDDITLPSSASGEGLSLIAPDLSGFGSEAGNIIDLSEFKIFIDNVLEQKQKVSREDLKLRNFTADMNRVAIQTIVTSPYKYVVINNQRFSEGDRFILPVEASLSSEDVAEKINKYLPPERSVDKQTYQEYTKLRDKAVNDYKIKKEKASKKSRVVQNLSVTIREIMHRRIKVSVFGKTYDIKLKFKL